MNSLSFVGIMPAAGIGSRMRSAIPKQYLQLAGRPLIEHSLLALLVDSRIQKIVVALHAEDQHFRQLAISRDPRIETVIGGSTRAESVLNALQNLQDKEQVIAVVHDAARPCLSAEDLKKLLDRVESDPHSGALLASPVRDTMKRSSGGHVLHTEPRADLWHALTPQAFIAADLATQLAAAGRSNTEITDEASAMEWSGSKPALVEGSSHNIKVTQAGDLALAAWLLQQSSWSGDK